jgi:F-type H+-transporting ATPase subunit epsilon
MSDSSLHIDIVTPTGKVFSGEIKSCTAPGVDGEFCILENHAALLSALNVGRIKIESAGEKKNLATSGGFLEVINNCISIMVETSEWAEQIDVERARAAADRARKRIAQKEDIDVPRARLALARALNRLKVSSRG